ncbi:MAG: histidinol-phosphate transaminase [Clostridiales bacterium]|nr:histidinol-phosphate transaminase [Clostridiales bacterium]
MSRFFDPKYESLEAYTPGEQPKDNVLLKLNTNECPYPTSPKVLAAIEAEKAFRLYPDPTSSRAVAAIAAYYDLDEDQVAVGNGSDEILAFAFMAYGRKICYPSISYGFYPVFSQVFGCDAEEIQLTEDLRIDLGDYMDKDRTVLIANPNAPTGIAHPRAAIEQLVSKDQDRLVIVDEAYVDFGAESCVPLIKKYDNILVVQTMSKSRSLAGMRIGMAMGSAALIRDLNTIKFSFNPYDLSREAIAAAAAAMEDTAYFEETRGKIIAARERFTKDMQALGFEVLPSCANFVFAKTGSEYFHAMRAEGIILRHFDKDPIRDWVRITIGTEEQMDRLTGATKAWLAAQK